MLGVSLQDVIARQGLFELVGERPKCLNQAALPIDERAVTVESKNLKIAEAHNRASHKSREPRI
jgi:hypothetical protein